MKIKQYMGLAALAVFVFFQSCNEDSIEKKVVGNKDNEISASSTFSGGTGTTYFQENVAIVEARIRSLSATEYVRELEFMDFDGTFPIEQRIGFLDDNWFDDGTNGDLVIGDGIYTSALSYPHTTVNPYDPNNLEHPVEIEMIAIADSANFQHQLALDSVLIDKGSLRPGVTVKITCDFEPVGCSDPRATCNACEWWGWPGCILVSNCAKTEIIIKF